MSNLTSFLIPLIYWRLPVSNETNEWTMLISWRLAWHPTPLSKVLLYHNSLSGSQQAATYTNQISSNPDQNKVTWSSSTNISHISHIIFIIIGALQIWEQKCIRPQPAGVGYKWKNQSGSCRKVQHDVTQTRSDIFTQALLTFNPRTLTTDSMTHVWAKRRPQ